MDSHKVEHEMQPPFSYLFNTPCTSLCQGAAFLTDKWSLAGVSPSPPVTTIAGCACNTTSNTVPQPAPTVTFTQTDSCTPEGRATANSSTGAVYFTAQVQFNGPVQAGTLSPDSFGVGQVAPPNVTGNSSSNCSCGTSPRRETVPGGSSLSAFA